MTMKPPDRGDRGEFEAFSDMRKMTRLKIRDKAKPLQFSWLPSVGCQHIYELKGGADKGKKQQTQAGIVFSS
jgi:hypothetical protein